MDSPHNWSDAIIKWFPAISGAVLALAWAAVRIRRRIKLHFTDPIARTSLLEEKHKIVMDRFDTHEQADRDRAKELAEQEHKTHTDIIAAIGKLQGRLEK